MPTFQALTDSEVVAANEGRPTWIGANALELTDTAIWSVNGGDFGDSALDASGLTAATYDLSASSRTGPELAGATPTVLTLAWELPANDRVVDAVAVIGTNLRSVAEAYADTINVDFATADSSDFGTGLTSLASWEVTAAGPNRLAALASTAVVGQRWFRLTFELDGGGNWVSVTGLPQIGEVFVGKRRAMPFRPQRPYDSDASDALEDTITMPGGEIVGVRGARGRGFWRVEWRLRQDAQGTEARDVLRAWWRDCYGAPSIWMPDASASLTSRAHLVRALDPTLEIPEVYLQLQQAEVEMVELPPFYDFETRSVGI